MHNIVKISDEVYWLGENDRHTQLFENYWPLENGVSYNSYIIVDEKVCLIDTMEASMANDFFEKISHLLGERKIDYIVINHMEPDHSGAMKQILKEYPEAKVIATKMAFIMMKSFYGIDGAKHIVAKEGDTLNLGNHILKFVLTPWVHWPETMMTYEINKKILFSGDAFGSFGTLDGGLFDDEINLEFYEDELLRYYSNIVGKFSDKVQDALHKLEKLELNLICATHGPIWRTEIKRIVNDYQNWSSYKTQKGVVIVFGSMYGNTEKMADAIARRLAERGIKNIRIYDSSKTHISYIIRDIWKFKGLIIGSTTYNDGIFPKIEELINKIKYNNIKDHLLGLFGSGSWNVMSVKALKDFSNEINWELVHEPAEARSNPDITAFEKCAMIGDAMANRLKDIYG